MATIIQQAPVLPAPSGRAGFGGTLRSEFTKIGSVRSTYQTLLALLAVSVVIGAVISSWSAPSSSIFRRPTGPRSTPPSSASPGCWSSASLSS